MSLMLFFVNLLLMLCTACPHLKLISLHILKSNDQLNFFNYVYLFPASSRESRYFFVCLFCIFGSQPLQQALINSVCILYQQNS